MICSARTLRSPGKRRFARYTPHPRPPAQPPQHWVAGDPVQQLPRCRKVPDRLGDERPRQSHPVLHRTPAPATAANSNKALHRDHVENRNQAPVLRVQFPYLPGQFGEQFALKPVPDIG